MFRAMATAQHLQDEQGLEMEGLDEEPLIEDEVFEAGYTESRGSSVKRTICKFWEEGTCKNGSNCTWAHGEEELGLPLSLSTPERIGPNAKRTTCKFWLQGTCTKRPSCTFAHGDQERVGAPTPSPAPQNLWQGLMQRRNASASASIGRALGSPRLSAPTGPNTKRTICRFWEQGLCAKGNDCTFAHGDEEIGAPMTEPFRQAKVEGPAVALCGDDFLPAFAGIAGGGGGGNTKRTICKFWEQGTCARGSECTWAHGEEELGVPALPPPAPPPAALPEPAQPFARPPRSQPLGYGFAKGRGKEASPASPASGRLSHFGVSKVFTSDPFQALPSLAEDASKGRSSNVPRWNGGKGVAEQPLKKTICKFWLEGQCSRGENCTWAHGDEDRMAGPPPAMAPPASKGCGGGAVAQSQEEGSSLRRSICKFWEQGKCSQAAGQCTWAHGEWEIGTPVRSSTAKPGKGKGYQGYQANFKRQRIS